MEELIENINCLRFIAKEKVLKELTGEINNEKDSAGKAEYAQKILTELKPLLLCEEHNEKKTDCKNCHIISSLRKQAVDIILKMHNPH